MQKTTTPKPLEFVKIGGTARPVRFGFNALATFSAAANIPLNALPRLSGDTLNLQQVLFLVWAGLREGARKAGYDFEVTPEDVGDWLDDSPGAIEQVLGIFAASQGAPAAPAETEGKGVGAPAK
jgi:hypothetical protein